MDGGEVLKHSKVIEIPSEGAVLLLLEQGKTFLGVITKGLPKITMSHAVSMENKNLDHSKILTKNLNNSKNICTMLFNHSLFFSNLF